MAKAKTKRDEAREFAAALAGVIRNLPPLPGDGEKHRADALAFLAKQAEG